MRISLLTSVALLLSSPALAHDETPSPNPESVAEVAPDWAFEDSDIPVDPAFTFGALPNGMRYIIRENATPAGTALIRMRIGSGSLAETDSELGLAHFLEHMAFNGSANVPEGQMIKLLEREGLAFGADTNASTGLEATTYKLDLPRNDAALLDTALMIMRETASELTIAPDAVDRERGVILAERRDRTNFNFRQTLDQFAFNTPDARFTTRLPIGAIEVLNNASADDLRGFYEREYVPVNTVLVIIGDFDPALVETQIRDKFASWEMAPAPQPGVTGPVDPNRGGAVDIYLDPALPEKVTVSRKSAWTDRPDNIAARQQNLLRTIGYGIINRRLSSVARREDAPFRSAGFGTGDIFEDARVTRLVVNTPDGEWQAGLDAAGREMRRALQFGFTQAELAEQLANIRTAQENAARSADTRGNGALTGAAIALVDREIVPSTPQSSLIRFEAFAPSITTDRVLAALLEDTTPLDSANAGPLIRFTGRAAPAGGEDGLRDTWQRVIQAELEPLAPQAAAQFAYTDFGPAGLIVEDQTNDALGIRTLRFANGVRLNLKRTDLAKDRVRFSAEIDGGDFLDTADNPLATAMVGQLSRGGLGAHSADEIQSVLAGRSVGYGLRSSSEVFYMGASTTLRDLELQLQLATALLTDPGYRAEAETQYQRSIANFFANRDATPGRALGNRLGGILSDEDPRFTLQNREQYEQLSFARLRADIQDRLTNGAIEIALVGDFDEQTAITLAAKTFGALPQRETDFRTYQDARQRSFTADRTPRALSHSGEADQALLRLLWPTTDDKDHAEELRLGLLARVLRLELTDELRERLGQAYSPGASSSSSSVFDDYGTFTISASLDAALVDDARAAMLAVVERLRDIPPTMDTLNRARRPQLEAYDNALKSNAGWARLVDRAQTKPRRLERFMAGRALLEAITPADIQSTAQTYLTPAQVLEVLVIPEALLTKASDSAGPVGE